MKTTVGNTRRYGQHVQAQKYAHGKYSHRVKILFLLSGLTGKKKKKKKKEKKKEKKRKRNSFTNRSIAGEIKSRTFRRTFHSSFPLAGYSFLIFKL